MFRPRHLRAWLRHIALIFPGQKLTPEQLIAFARRFGPLDDHREDPVSRLDGYPEIFFIGNHMVNGKLSKTRDTGRLWHSDDSVHDPTDLDQHAGLPKPTSHGRDNFVLQHVYRVDTLSDTMRMLDKLEGVHELLHLGSRSTTLYRTPSFKDPASIAERYPPVAHPLVRVHPETGKKALYVSEGPVSRIVGLTDDEGRGLLQFLFKHAANWSLPIGTYSEDDLVFWDTRLASTLHWRIMCRIRTPRE